MIRRTPLVAPGGQAGARLGSGVVLKLESAQRTGSFKLRGAAAAVAGLSDAERAVGVITSSAGNHGAGMALVCSRAGIQLTVVVGQGAPEVKRSAIAALGAELVIEGADYDEAERAARELARRRGARFVSPYDDEDVMHGNGGGVAAELLEQAPDLARVLVPIGGGGLAAGMAAALAPRGIAVVGVQPATNCAMHDSLACGRPLVDYQGGPTIADALAGGCGERTFRLCAFHLDSVALVTEAEIRGAVAFLYREVGVIAEPSAAVGVAVLLAGTARAAPTGTTAVVVSGANIDPDLLDQILAEPGLG
jgi:threonine dehydratase